MVPCEKCIEIYDGNPPCDECDMPELMPGNQQAWELWSILHRFDRPVYPAVYRIPATSMLYLCEQMGASQTTFYKILEIEEAAYPNIVNKFNEMNKQAQQKEAKEQSPKPWERR